MTDTGLQPPILAAVLDLVRERHGERLDVSTLADHAGYSPFHFSRLFTASMSLTPAQYVTAVRIDAAKRLLMARDEPVIDIAVAVGFDSLSSFSRRFRATVGVPPAALRALTRRVEDRPPAPFALFPADDGGAAVVHPRLPHGVSDGSMLWIGWFPRPAPIGLPAGGLLTPYDEAIALPLAPGAPWLLGFAIEPGDSVHHQLAPERPLVAVTPGPVTRPGQVDLVFTRALPGAVPMLPALPSLCRAAN